MSNHQRRRDRTVHTLDGRVDGNGSCRLGFLLCAVIAIWMAPRIAQACAKASRERLLPLGTVGQEIVVLELQEHRRTGFGHSTRAFGFQRGSSFGGSPVYWVAEARLRRYDAQGRPRPGGVPLGRFFARVDFEPLDTRRAVDSALARAGRIPGFRVLPPPTYHDCSDDVRCGTGRLVHKGTDVFLLVPGARLRVAGEAQLRKVAEEMNADAHHHTTAAALAGELRARYLLIYRWGSRDIYATMVSSGFDSLWAPRRWIPRYCGALRTCIPPASLNAHQIAIGAVGVAPHAADTRRPPRRPR